MNLHILQMTFCTFDVIYADVEQKRRQNHINFI